MNTTDSAQLAAQLGTILYSSWGYDQTNVDFYEVVKATVKTITLRQIKADRTDGEAWGNYSVSPKAGQYIGDPFRRTPRKWSSRLAVSINSFANAYEWDGDTKNATDYA
jgi:hypothetical protein